MSKYCIYCGGSGYTVNNVPCTKCKSRVDVTKEVDLSSLEIPLAYRGVQFSSGLLPSNMGTMYNNFMGQLYDEITSLRPMCKNIFISAPHQTGKTVFVYSCMEFLYKKENNVFPYLDLSELESVMRDIDKAKKSKVVNSDVDIFQLYETEILFAKIPEKLEYNTGEVLSLLIDRRVRRGLSTIIMSSRSWSDLVNDDKTNTLKNMSGDGSYKSILVKTFWRDK